MKSRSAAQESTRQAVGCFFFSYLGLSELQRGLIPVIIRLFMAIFWLSLNFRNGLLIIFGDMQLMVAFRTMRFFRVRSSHSCFCHIEASLS